MTFSSYGLKCITPISLSFSPPTMFLQKKFIKIYLLQEAFLNWPLTLVFWGWWNKLPQIQRLKTTLVAQIVKNLSAMQDTWVWSLGWDDPLEKGMATHSNILAWRIPMDRGAWQTTVHGVTKSQSWLSTKHKASQIYYLTVLWVISLTQFSSGQIQEFKVSTEFILFWSL